LGSVHNWQFHALARSSPERRDSLSYLGREKIVQHLAGLGRLCQSDVRKLPDHDYFTILALCYEAEGVRSFQGLTVNWVGYDYF
jgi:hypothetical protein